MIRQECYSKEWIQKVSTNLHYPDVNLIEKVIRAFSLVELLSSSIHVEGRNRIDVIIVRKTPQALNRH